MKKIFLKIKNLAPSKMPVLIVGESGTGTEIIAQAIHSNSGRKGSFIATLASTYPNSLSLETLFGKKNEKGDIKKANGGTLLLRNINEMSEYMKGKITQVIEQSIDTRHEKKVNVRFVASCHWSASSSFSYAQDIGEDFYRVLAGKDRVIEIPSLRERKEDIPLLVEYFIDHYRIKLGLCHIKGISPEAIELLIRCNWYGNVRELENILLKSMCLTKKPIITSNDLIDQLYLE